MGGTLASRATGLAREVLLVALFPVRATDAFRLAWTIPNLFRELLAEGALTNAFIPQYQRLPPEERRAFAGAMAAVLALANAVLVALALLLAPALVDLLLASGANVDRDLAVQLLRITFPTLAAISLAALAMGVLNAEERFLAPAWAPVALNAVAIGVMLLFPAQAGALAWGMVAGGVAQALVQWPAMLRAGIAPQLGLLWHAALPATLALMAPFAFTTGARQFLNVVAQRIVSDASLFPPGAVTAYALAAMLFSLALGLFAISPAVAYFSRLGNVAAEGGDAFRSTLHAGVRFIVLLSVPAGLAMFAFAEPAVRVLFQFLRPAAGQEVTIELAARALAPLGLALAPAGLVNFLLRPFYVRGEVRAPVALSVLFTVGTAALFVALAPLYGIAGLSWATAVAMTLQTLVLLVWLSRREGLDLRGVAGHMGLVLVAGVGAVAVARVVASAAVAALPVAGWWGHFVELGVGGVVIVAVLAAVVVPLRGPLLKER
jgi:putative peptidoglycan lipid II flippase